MKINLTCLFIFRGAHAAISPNFTNATFAPFDDTPGVFDNHIFKNILAGDCVLKVDCAMMQVPELVPFIQQLSLILLLYGC